MNSITWYYRNYVQQQGKQLTSTPVLEARGKHATAILRFARGKYLADIYLIGRWWGGAEKDTLSAAKEYAEKQLKRY